MRMTRTPTPICTIRARSCTSASRPGRGFSGTTIVALLIAGVMAACADESSQELNDDTQPGTSIEQPETSVTVETIDEGPVPPEATGVGPVDSDHPCGGLAVDEVAEVTSDATGATIDGATCYYVDDNGGDLLGVDVHDTPSPDDAVAAFSDAARRFDPAFDSTGAGCEPVELGDEAAWCTRTTDQYAPSLVVRSASTVVELLAFGPRDRSDITDLAEQVLDRLA
jgi:hypothetical protein